MLPHNTTTNNLQSTPVSNPLNPLTPINPFTNISLTHPQPFNPSPFSNPNFPPSMPPPTYQTQQEVIQRSFESLFPEANRTTPEERKIITNFLEGKQAENCPVENSIVQIIVNEKEVSTEDGRLWLEQIIFEMNYNLSSWRSLRRRNQN